MLPVHFVSVGSLVFRIVEKTRATTLGVRSWRRTILPQQPKRNVGMLPRTLPYYYICVLILLYMCPHTTLCVLSITTAAKTQHRHVAAASAHFRHDSSGTRCSLYLLYLYKV